MGNCRDLGIISSGNSVSGCFEGFWAIVLATFGAQVGVSGYLSYLIAI